MARMSCPSLYLLRGWFVVALAFGGWRRPVSSSPAPFFLFANAAEAADASQVKTVSRQYADAALSRGEDYWGYATREVTERWHPSDRYEVTSYLGDGTNSVVLAAEDLEEGKRVALKVLRPTTAKRIRREIKSMQALRGCCGALSLLAMCRDPSSGTTTLVLEPALPGSAWLAHGAWQSPLSIREISHYIFKLLKALDHCHSAGVMHRDIKPGNVLIHRASGTLKLVDWGLADFYLPGKKYATRVGTRAYKAPEMLVRYRFYDYAVDIFSVGCILAGLLFRKEPFFGGSSDDDQLCQIAATLGTDGLLSFCQNRNIHLEPELWASIGSHERKEWSSFLSPDSARVSDVERAFSLLDGMLCYDHQKRLTAQEAMAHPFFDEVREQQCANSEGRKLPQPPSSPPPPLDRFLPSSYS